METVAFWALFFGVLPILYWGFRLFFDNLIEKFLPHHIVTLEVQKEDGSWTSTQLDMSNDREFYRVSLAILNKERQIDGDKK